MNALLTTVIGTLLEAWQELRVHRGRVVLSLIGVTIAVASLAVVVGFGSLAERVTAVFNDQYGGRPATYVLNGAAESGDVLADQGAFVDAVRAGADRYGVRFVSEATDSTRAVQFPDGVSDVMTKTIDPAYGEIHRVRVDDGAWFSDEDRDRLAPAILVNHAFLDRLGGVDLESHPTVRLPGAPTRTAVVVGVYATSDYDTEPAMYQLARSVATDSVAHTAQADNPARAVEVWVPDHGSKRLAERIASDVERAIGDGAEVTASRLDAGGSVDGDPLGPLRAVIAAVAIIVLVLGGLGLLNVSLVSVRQRIREIGIRRGVGASASRVFVAVLLENVLGTAVAGGVGVLLGAAVLGNETVRSGITGGVDVGGAPFPLEAALVGIGSAVAVGAIAGFLPALVAVRVKVIDAIRY